MLRMRFYLARSQLNSGVSQTYNATRTATWRSSARSRREPAWTNRD